MKKLYVYCYSGDSDEIGEVEGIFDDKFVLLDFWHCNDANWSNEYFGGFINKLGFTISGLPKNKQKQADKQFEARIL
jgi:hypothetical protein